MTWRIEEYSMAPMRIAVDARALEAHPTGVGRYLEGLLSAWLASHPGDSFVLLSPRAVTVPSSLEGRLENRTRLRRIPGTVWLQTHAVSEAVAAGAHAFFGPLGILPLISPLPGVATVHDLTPVLFPEWHSWRNRLGFSPLLGPTVRVARRLAAVSETTRRDLVARHPTAAAKCVVVPNGLVPAPPDPGGPPPNEGRPYVLFLGTLEPRKNLPRLLQALESIWDRRPDFPGLLIAGGEGWGLADLSQRIAFSRHAARIRTAGYVSAAEAAKLVRAARLLAYPSLYEGFGFPPLEAMALGTVVVGSSASSLPELIGDAGLLPDPWDERALAAALEKAHDDEVWRALARSRGLARARDFTWERAAARMRPLFEEALA
jgi:glycosyltransferase involved in cell wall biosynthesis